MMIGLCEVFDKKPSEYIFSIYYEALKTFPLEAVERAIGQCIRSHKYNTLPKPATILEFLEGKEEERSLSAWHQVMNTIKKHGYYESIEFEDKIIHSCVEALGGWAWLCSQSIDNLRFIEKEFLKLYRMFFYYPREPITRLVGYLEATNRKTGFKNEDVKTIYIGKKQLRQITNERD